VGRHQTFSSLKRGDKDWPREQAVGNAKRRWKKGRAGGAARDDPKKKKNYWQKGSGRRRAHQLLRSANPSGSTVHKATEKSRGGILVMGNAISHLRMSKKQCLREV